MTTNVVEGNEESRELPIHGLEALGTKVADDDIYFLGNLCDSYRFWSPLVAHL
jgi:hypothetical protein